MSQLQAKAWVKRLHTMASTGQWMAMLEIEYNTYDAQLMIARLEAE